MPYHAHARVVRRFHDGHHSLPAIGLPIPGHAQAVAAVEVMVCRLDRRVGRRVADSLVQRQNEKGLVVGRQRLRKGYRTGQLRRGGQLPHHLGPLRFQADRGLHPQHGGRIQERQVESGIDGLGVQRDERAAGPLGPTASAAPIGKRQRAIGRLEDNLQELVFRLQCCRQVVAPHLVHAALQHQACLAEPDGCRAAANQSRLHGLAPGRHDEPRLQASPTFRSVGGLTGKDPIRDLVARIPQGHAERGIAPALEPHPAAQFVDLARLDRQRPLLGETPVFLARVLDPHHRGTAMPLLRVEGEFSARRSRPEVAPSGQSLLEIAVDQEVFLGRRSDSQDKENRRKTCNHSYPPIFCSLPNGMRWCRSVSQRGNDAIVQEERAICKDQSKNRSKRPLLTKVGGCSKPSSA